MVECRIRLVPSEFKGVASQHNGEHLLWRDAVNDIALSPELGKLCLFSPLDSSKYVKLTGSVGIMSVPPT